MNNKRIFLYIAIAATVLAFGVVMLGAYVRLSAAGLGCPDWPGCYGHVAVPTEQQAAEFDVQGRTNAAGGRMPGAADAAKPLEAARAWKEMIHRYFAGSLVTLILVLAALAWWNRKDKDQPLLLPTLLLALVVFQALLGMWTVTLKLFPPVVMGHLLGGMSTFILCLLLVLQTSGWLRAGEGAARWLRVLAALGLAALICQIALGGWVSSNYAAIACPDFPTCQGSWWPAANFGQGFSWQGVGPDYQGGLLDTPARVAIHLTHRLGALLTLLLLGVASLAVVFRSRHPLLWALGLTVWVLLLTQITLGISLVRFGLPLPVADLHNGVAALLLASAVALNWSLNTRANAS